jgi:AraC family L-rhamnose operon regulatory protein RhaS
LQIGQFRAVSVSGPIPVTLPGYGVLFAESVHAADFRMAERADPFHKLIYVLKGQVEYLELHRAKPVQAGPGTVLVVPRGVAHRIADREASTLLLLCLDGDFLGIDADLPRLWLVLARIADHRLALSRPARQRLESMWRRAMVEREHARVGGHVTVRTLAAQTLVMLARLPPEGGGAAAEDRVAAVLREMEETFYDQWSIDRAAARAGLSRRRFTELFRAATGRTFWEVLNARRLEHAAVLLRGREHSILGVMFASGFNDLSHFYRMFRHHHGSPPGAWLTREAPKQSAGRCRARRTGICRVTHATGRRAKPDQTRSSLNK